jgi:hypothetical protein
MHFAFAIYNHIAIKNYRCKHYNFTGKLFLVSPKDMSRRDQIFKQRIR